jgi:hypothetical protein
LITRLELPLIEPDTHALIAQTPGQLFTPFGIFARVAEKDIVLYFLIGHPLTSIRGAEKLRSRTKLTTKTRITPRKYMGIEAFKNLLSKFQTELKTFPVPSL